VNQGSDKKYYIDFSSVRGGDIIGKLKQKITFFKANEPTCTLSTGHIDCGKSTELVRLQVELEDSGYHVVYFESSEDLEMTDVDIADVLLAIAVRASVSFGEGLRRAYRSPCGQSLEKIMLDELEQEKQQRKLGEVKLNSFLKRALFGSVAAGVVLAALAVTAFFQTQQAKGQRNLDLEQINLATISEINALTNSSEAHLVSGKSKDAIVEALKANEKLPSWASNDIQLKSVTAFQQAVYLRPTENLANRAIELNTLEGHTDSVWGVVYSPDGKTLASSSGDKTIKIWNINTGKPIKTLTGHTDFVYGVVYSPDGKTLASSSRDKTIKIWNINTGKPIKTLTGHTDSVFGIVYSPDGKTLASSSRDNTIKIWNINTGKPIRTLTGHTDSVFGVAYSPDGKTLASSSLDRTIRIWDINTGKPIRTLTGHTGYVYGVAYSPDGKTLASSSRDKTIKIWDINTGKPIKTLTGHTNSVRGIAYSPDGKTLASSSADKTIKIWNINTGKAIKTLTGHTDSVWGAVYSPDGKTLASSSFDKTVILWTVTEIPDLQGNK
jgi:WD40 repeat protein